MNKNNLKHYLFFLIVSVNCLLQAQTNFGKYAFNGEVLSIVNAPDGSTYIGGFFTGVGLYTGSGVSLDPISGVWNDSDVKVKGTVNCVIVIPQDLGGGWYIGGDFNSINGQVRNRLARINADGTLHAFNPNLNQAVYALALDNGGNLYVGGNFTMVNESISRNRLAKFDSAGVLTNFNPNMNDKVRSFALDDSGNLFVGGQFTTIGGITRNRLAKFDNVGVLTNFNPNMGVVLGLSICTVSDLLLDANGNLYAGGFFNTVGGAVAEGGISRNHLAKFDNMGVLQPFSPEMNSTVFDLELDATGNLYVAGGFSQIDGISRNRLARFNADGTLDDYDPNLNGNVYAIALDETGNLYVGGGFYTIGITTPHSYLAKFDDMGVLMTFDLKLNGIVNTLAFDASGNLFVGGEFTTFESKIRNRLAKFNTDGVLSDDFNPNMNGAVGALAIDEEGNLYVGGWFTTVGEVAIRYRLAKFDNAGVLTSFNPELNANVLALELDLDGNLFVGGGFTSINGIPRNRLAKFDNTGVLTNFDPNINQAVFALELDLSGNLYAGGTFSTVGGLTRNNLAKFDNLGNLTSFDPNMQNGVYALTVDASGFLYVGGEFNSLGGWPGTPRLKLAKFDNSGALMSFDPSMNNAVRSLILDENQNLYVGGEFTTVGGSTTRNYLAKFNNMGGLTNFDPNMNERVRSLVFDVNGNLHAGGSFTTGYTYFCNPISVTSITPGAVCEAGVVNLEATASSGAILNWYTNSTGGNSLFTGVTFTTPYILETTTYYVEAGNGLCVSAERTPVVATINNVDVSVTNNWPIVTSNAIGATYQWLDCNNGNESISGETNQSFIATGNGNYAIEVTENGCVDTTACINVSGSMTCPIGIHLATDVSTCDGEAYVGYVQNGVAPYTYDWTGMGVFSTDSITTGLCTGIYNVTIKDQNNDMKICPFLMGSLDNGYFPPVEPSDTVIHLFTDYCIDPNIDSISVIGSEVIDSVSFSVIWSFYDNSALVDQFVDTFQIVIPYGTYDIIELYIHLFCDDDTIKAPSSIFSTYAYISLPFTETSSLNLGEWNDFLVNIYPNPFDNLIHIESEDVNLEKIMVFNEMGQEIKVVVSNVNSNHLIIDFSGINRGSYTIRMITHDGVPHFKKVIKM